MKTVFMSMVAFLGIVLAIGAEEPKKAHAVQVGVDLPGQEKKDDPAKEEVVVLKPKDFPIRVGPEIVKDKEEDAKRKEDACRKKYDGKLVKVVSIVTAKPAKKDGPQVYTLHIAYAVKRGNQFLPASMEIDFIPAKASPELHQPSRSGLIAEVVGRCHMDAKGRLLLKDAKVLGTSIPPG